MAAPPVEVMKRNPWLAPIMFVGSNQWRDSVFFDDVRMPHGVTFCRCFVYISDSNEGNEGAARSSRARHHSKLKRHI